MTILIVNLRFKFLGTDIHIFLLIGVYLFTPICYSNQYLLSRFSEYDYLPTAHP